MGSKCFKIFTTIIILMKYMVKRKLIYINDSSKSVRNRAVPLEISPTLKTSIASTAMTTRY